MPGSISRVGSLTMTPLPEEPDGWWLLSLIDCCLACLKWRFYMKFERFSGEVRYCCLVADAFLEADLTTLCAMTTPNAAPLGDLEDPLVLMTDWSTMNENEFTGLII